jgi:hypothetical protein
MNIMSIAAGDLALAQELLREAREEFWVGLAAPPAFDAALRSYEAARAISDRQLAERRAEKVNYEG